MPVVAVRRRSCRTQGGSSTVSPASLRSVSASPVHPPLAQPKPGHGLGQFRRTTSSCPAMFGTVPDFDRERAQMDDMRLAVLGSPPGIVHVWFSISSSDQRMPATSPSRCAVSSSSLNSGAEWLAEPIRGGPERAQSRRRRAPGRATLPLPGGRAPVVGSAGVRSLATAQPKNVRSLVSILPAWTAAPPVVPWRLRSRRAALSLTSSSTSPFVISATAVRPNAATRHARRCAAIPSRSSVSVPVAFGEVARHGCGNGVGRGRIASVRFSATGLSPAAAFSMLSRAACRASSTFGIRATGDRLHDALPSTRYVATQLLRRRRDPHPEAGQMAIPIDARPVGGAASFLNGGLRQSDCRHSVAPLGLPRGYQNRPIMGDRCMTFYAISEPKSQGFPADFLQFLATHEMHSVPLRKR